MNSVGEIVNGQYVSAVQATAVQRDRFADMLASRQAPKAMSDRELFAGVGTLEQQFSDNQPQLRHITKRAMELGYKPNPNDFYNSALVRPEVGTGDPQAFVPASGGRGYIQKRIEERGWSCEGAVSVKAPSVRQPKKKPRLAADLVAESVRNMVRADPALARVDKRDLAAEAIRKHGSKE